MKRFRECLQSDVMLNSDPTNFHKSEQWNANVLLGFYQNCCGLWTKLDLFKCNVSVFDNIFICLSNTWLCDNFHDNELGWPNCFVFRCDWSSFISYLGLWSWCAHCHTYWYWMQLHSRSCFSIWEYYYNKYIYIIKYNIISIMIILFYFSCLLRRRILWNVC